ncbi:hypothetical protein C8R45DRAFT_927422 [Mycena sanguinolenta]|nr:hypothetical protein C8R45DRAFT_927422 [Mycena sanguinolenta]
MYKLFAPGRIVGYDFGSWQNVGLKQRVEKYPGRVRRGKFNIRVCSLHQFPSKSTGYLEFQLEFTGQSSARPRRVCLRVIFLKVQVSCFRRVPLLRRSMFDVGFWPPLLFVQKFNTKCAHTGFAATMIERRSAERTPHHAPFCMSSFSLASNHDSNSDLFLDYLLCYGTSSTGFAETMFERAQILPKHFFGCAHKSQCAPSYTAVIPVLGSTVSNLASSTTYKALNLCFKFLEAEIMVKQIEYVRVDTVARTRARASFLQVLAGPVSPELGAVFRMHAKLFIVEIRVCTSSRLSVIKYARTPCAHPRVQCVALVVLPFKRMRDARLIRASRGKKDVISFQPANHLEIRRTYHASTYRRMHTLPSHHYVQPAWSTKGFGAGARLVRDTCCPIEASALTGDGAAHAPKYHQQHSTTTRPPNRAASSHRAPTREAWTRVAKRGKVECERVALIWMLPEIGRLRHRRVMPKSGMKRTTPRMGWYAQPATGIAWSKSMIERVSVETDWAQARRSRGATRELGYSVSIRNEWESGVHTVTWVKLAKNFPAERIDFEVFLILSEESEEGRESGPRPGSVAPGVPTPFLLDRSSLW